MNEQQTMLAVFYLRSGTSKNSLGVFQRHDTSIGYSYFSGWQPYGSGESLGNMQMKKPLPITVRDFKDVHTLVQAIKEVLGTGLYQPETIKILNDLQKVTPLKGEGKCRKQK